MRARDGGTPSLSSTVVLTVSVNRNLFAPLFLQNSYTVEISETTAPGTGILFVSASDNDVSGSNNDLSFANANDVSGLINTINNGNFNDVSGNNN